MDDLNVQEFAVGFAHQLRVLLERFDKDAFWQAQVSGFDIPICPVIVSATPDEWDMLVEEDVGTIFAYKHDGPPIEWNHFRFQNAYFIWTSPIAELVSRLRTHGLFSRTTLEHNMTVLTLLLVRKRVVRYARCIPAFRRYVLNDLPLAIRGGIFQDSFFKESISAGDYERIDQLVLARLFSEALKTRKPNEDYAACVDLLVHRKSI